MISTVGTNRRATIVDLGSQLFWHLSLPVSSSRPIVVLSVSIRKLVAADILSVVIASTVPYCGIMFAKLTVLALAAALVVAEETCMTNPARSQPGRGGGAWGRHTRFQITLVLLTSS